MRLAQCLLISRHMGGGTEQGVATVQLAASKSAWVGTKHWPLLCLASCIIRCARCCVHAPAPLAVCFSLRPGHLCRMQSLPSADLFVQYLEMKASCTQEPGWLHSLPVPWSCCMFRSPDLNPLSFVLRWLWMQTEVMRSVCQQPIRLPPA